MTFTLFGSEETLRHSSIHSSLQMSIGREGEVEIAEFVPIAHFEGFIGDSDHANLCRTLASHPIYLWWPCCEIEKTCLL